jgi:hypothetical protein
MKDPICISGPKYRKIEKRVIRGGKHIKYKTCSVQRLWETPVEIDSFKPGNGHDGVVFRIVRNR